MRSLSLIESRTLALIVCWLGIACRSDRVDTTSVPAQSQDFRQICEVRAKWTRRIHQSCTKCLAISTVPRCEDCPLHEQAGRCAEEQKARSAEGSCAEVSQCLFRCARNDCDCIEACYQGKDVCRKLDAAIDACTTKACAADCR